MSIPEVSVIMPCYNHSRYLPESIESILGQSYGDLELIIADDCSSDNSVDVIESFKRRDKRIIGIYNKENKGASGSRNSAMTASKGNYVAFCDADDVWEKEKLRIQMNCMLNNRGYAAIHSDSTIIDGQGNPTGERFSSLHQSKKRSGSLFHELCIANFINIQTVLLRRQCVNDVGLFEEDIKYVEDWIYWVKVANRFNFFYIDEPLGRYRVHEGSTNKNIEGCTKNLIKGYNRILSNFPDIPKKIRARIYYELGINHAALGEKVEARKYFLGSFKKDKLNLKSFLRYCSNQVSLIT
jgi:glycosyltransferase involved in cell wall biosynthesis